MNLTMAKTYEIWYNHLMHRGLKRTGTILLIVLAIALYREWIVRNKPPLFLPLGFFESAEPVITPEKRVSQPSAWIDPITNVVMNDVDFAEAVASANAEKKTVDILVYGGTLGGTAAALSAADDGASVLLVTEDGWDENMPTYAGLFLEEAPPPVDTSALEAEIRRYLTRARGITGTERGLPNDVTKYLRMNIDALPQNILLSEYSIVALARDESGHLHGALVRSRDGTHSVAIEFSTIIDGTKEGTLLALAGIPTVSGWDANTGEPSAIPNEALTAIREGYTMSGRTIDGIGQRLDGVRAQIGIIDRGYHGTFLAPNAVDDCWKTDVETVSTIARSTVMRTNTIGCAARFTFHSSFQDTYEIFSVNHGNEGISAIVRTGSGAPLHVQTIDDPSSPFLRVGAFSTDGSSPLLIEIRSSLPNDRLEGLIVRKLNTNAPPTSLALLRGRETVYVAGPWTRTNYDVYVRKAGLVSPPTLLIDGQIIATKRAGSGTYIASNVPMNHGERHIRIAEDDIDEAVISFMPLSPSTALANSPVTVQAPESTSWKWTPSRDGTIVVQLPRRMCETECSFSMIDAKGRIVLSQSAGALAGRPATVALLGIADVTHESTYTLSVRSTSKDPPAPILSYIEENAGIHEMGKNNVVLDVPYDGRMYDIWVRAPRAETATVTIGGTTTTVEARDSWAYAGTAIASFGDVSARAGGFVEMFAVPNASLDVYALTLPPKQSIAISQENLPSGTYDISAYSETNPRAISVKNGQNDTVQQIAFEEATGYFVSQQPLIWHKNDVLLASSSEWPLRLIIHQTVEKSGDAPLEHTESPLFTTLARPLSIVDDSIAMRASGSMLFTPAPSGIAPVTIGLLEHPQTDAYVRSVLDDAFTRLRYADLRESCPNTNDPTCDPRRYVRDPATLGTNDSQSRHAIATDGRRLLGMETLTESGAFAIRSACQSACNASCIPGTIEKGTCYETLKHRSSTSNAIVAVRGTASLPSIDSSTEKQVETVSTLLRSLRRDKRLGAKKTYIEEALVPRDFSLSLEMFLPRDETNVLVANTTLSMTHIASRALRSSSTELAIGSAIGHVAAFAALNERSTPSSLLHSSDVMKRLQRYLVDKGVMIVPTFDIANDHLLLKGVQRRILDGRASTGVTWKDGRLTQSTDTTLGKQTEALTIDAFGDPSVRTVEEALAKMPGAPSRENPLILLNFGIINGFVSQKMLHLNAREILGQELTTDLLLKAEYLLHSQP